LVGVIQRESLENPARLIKLASVFVVNAECAAVFGISFKPFFVLCEASFEISVKRSLGWSVGHHP
jgi:hypothetical protein